MKLLKHGAQRNHFVGVFLQIMKEAWGCSHGPYFTDIISIFLVMVNYQIDSCV